MYGRGMSGLMSAMVAFFIVLMFAPSLLSAYSRAISEMDAETLAPAAITKTLSLQLGAATEQYDETGVWPASLAGVPVDSVENSDRVTSEVSQRAGAEFCVDAVYENVDFSYYASSFISSDLARGVHPGTCEAGSVAAQNAPALADIPALSEEDSLTSTASSIFSVIKWAFFAVIGAFILIIVVSGVIMGVYSYRESDAVEQKRQKKEQKEAAAALENAAVKGYGTGKTFSGDSRSPSRRSVRREEARAAKEAAAAREASLRTRRQRAAGLLAELRTESYEVEGSILARLDFPALFDYSDQRTIEWVEANAAVTALDAESPLFDGDSVREFERSVTAARVAWAAALANARRVRHSRFSEEERRKVEKARKLLEHVLDAASSLPERRACYDRAIALLEGVLDVPHKVLVEIEAVARLEIASA